MRHSIMSRLFLNGRTKKCIHLINVPCRTTSGSPSDLEAECGIVIFHVNYTTEKSHWK